MDHISYSLKDELVTLETARLAKEKGFSEQCMHFFRDNGKEGNYQTLFYINGMTNLTARPTQSHLQRWLREVYKEHINVTYFPQSKNYGSSLTMRSMGWTDFTSYEEALEVVLQKALELIK